MYTCTVGFYVCTHVLWGSMYVRMYCGVLCTHVLWDSMYVGMYCWVPLYMRTFFAGEDHPTIEQFVISITFSHGNHLDSPKYTEKCIVAVLSVSMFITAQTVR